MISTPSRKIIITKDGSRTIGIDNGISQVSYRSLNGARTESNFVFVQGCNLSRFSPEETINVLELGFGTGRNFLETAVFATKNSLNLNYISFEKEILNYKSLQELFKEELEERKELVKPFYLVDKCLNSEVLCSSSNIINEKLSLKIINKDIAQVENLREAVGDLKINAIYHDPFAPNYDISPWTVEVFKKYLTVVDSSTILATYSSAGKVRRALESCGFEITVRGGEHVIMTLGKREVITAKLP